MQTALQQNLLSAPKTVNLPGDSLIESILKLLAYFDIFQYPLLKKEIKQFLDQPVIDLALDKTLERLVAEKKIFRLGEFYSLQNEPLLFQKRKQGNLRADKLLVKAYKIGRFLCHFPFVRAIGISGSLSKHYAEEKADIDFFIITKANRLWIARTLMHLFKKFTYIVGRQHFYCMNYYVDETALEVEDKNIYTAIEVKTLLPVSANHVMEEFLDANDWTDGFLPACNRNQKLYAAQTTTWLKKWLEWLFRNKSGDRLDTYLMKITSRRWKQKEEKRKQNAKGQIMCLITGKHFARSNPGSFQEKILSRYAEKISELNL